MSAGKLFHLLAERLELQGVTAQRDLNFGIGIAIGILALASGRFHDFIWREDFYTHILGVWTALGMGIGEETDLNERHRNRGIAPGLQLAAVNGKRGYTFDALSPLTRLLMIGKFAPEWEKRAVIGAVGGIDQPAVKFYAGTRSRWLHTCTV